MSPPPPQLPHISLPIPPSARLSVPQTGTAALATPHMPAPPRHLRRIINAFQTLLASTPVCYARHLGVPVVLANKSGPWRSTFLGSSLIVFEGGFCGLSQIVDADGCAAADLSMRADLPRARLPAIIPPPPLPPRACAGLVGSTDFCC